MRTYDPPLYLISIKKAGGWNGSQGTNDPLEAERMFAAAVAHSADIGFERRCALTLRGERHRYAVPTAIKLELRGRVVAEATVNQDLDRLPFLGSRWPDLGEDRPDSEEQSLTSPPAASGPASPSR